MPFCTNCGKPVAPSAKFCTNCGKAVTKPNPPVNSTPVKSNPPIVKGTAKPQSTTPKAFNPTPSQVARTGKLQKTGPSSSTTTFSTKTSSPSKTTTSSYSSSSSQPVKPVGTAKTEINKSSSSKSSSSGLSVNKHGNLILTIDTGSKEKKKKCKYCKKEFDKNESYKVICGKYYHDQCVHCHKCDQRIFSMSKFYEDDGKILCYACMTKALPKCAHCKNPLKGTYMVVNGKNYHKECAPAH